MPFRPVAQREQIATPAPTSASTPSGASKSPRQRIRSVQPISPSTEAQPIDFPVLKGRLSKGKTSHPKVDRSGPNRDENGDYIVGKYRPAVATQWKPGQSGNPRGPKKREATDPAAAFDNAVLDEFVITVNGQSVKMNLGLFGLTMMKKFAKDDRKAVEFLIDLYLSKLRPRASEADEQDLLPEEQAMIAAMLENAGWGETPAIRQIRRPSDEAVMGKP